MSSEPAVHTPVVPLLLYDGGCATCSRIARWVQKSANGKTGGPTIVARPVGNDPTELRALNPTLDIWSAYAVSHVIMPDGSMKLGGEAVAEVFRRLPSTKWMASLFDLHFMGIRPFQIILNLAYRVLDDIRPILGCESCGRTKPWVRPLDRLMKWTTAAGGRGMKPGLPLHFRPLPRSHRPAVSGVHQPPSIARHN